MPKRTIFFVTPHKPSGWAVKKSPPYRRAVGRPPDDDTAEPLTE